MNPAPEQGRLEDRDSRSRKARKILAILRDHLGTDLSALTCLDLGCYAGLISNLLAKETNQVIGLDVDRAALFTGQRQKKADNLEFVLATAERLPFGDARFDVVICAQVYEHTPDPQAMMAEVWRVLKDDGVCFFSGPNRLELVEKHYRLPLLHWLPAPLASAYLRLTGKGARYDISPKTYWGLRSMLHRFDIMDYTAAILREPARYSCAEEIPLSSWVRGIPRWVWERLIWALPNYNWLLVKKRDE